MALDPDTLRMMQHLRQEIDRLWNYLGYDQEAKEYLSRADKIQAQVNSYRQELEDNFRKQFEESGKYFNTVMTVGYAGYFAAWTLTREHLDKWHASFIGLMGLASLALFICWELLVMQIRMRNLALIQNFFRNMISVEDFEPLRQQQLAKENREMMFFRPIWQLVFVFCCLTAALGAADLMLQLLRNLGAL